MLPTGFWGFVGFPSLPGNPPALLWPGAHRKLLPRHRLRDLQVQAGKSFAKG